MKDHGNKLVLFDIDGTLISSSLAGVAFWERRLSAVFEEVHHTPITFQLDIHEYNGMVDKQVMRAIAVRLGISRESFDQGYPRAKEVFHRVLKKAVTEGKIHYGMIRDAARLVGLVQKNQALFYGVLTGNLEQNAWLKLEDAGYHDNFTFGVFGDDAEERIDLIRDAFIKAQKHFGMPFAADDVFIIGDTVHDIRAAKRAGVRSIGVTTGYTSTHGHLMNEGADLVVTSLMDERVLSLLGLKHTR